jgi:hypothetical protein
MVVLTPVVGSRQTVQFPPRKVPVTHFVAERVLASSGHLCGGRTHGNVLAFVPGGNQHNESACILSVVVLPFRTRLGG